MTKLGIHPARVVVRAMHNIRDIGGLSLMDGRVVRCGVVYRGDLPCAGDETPELARWPPQTVLDLRSSAERRLEHPLAGPGTTVHSIPLASGDGIEQLLREGAGGGLVAFYRRILEQSGREVTRTVATVADAPGPVLVHCTLGKDRTGIVIAVLLAAVGVRREDVVADYVMTQANMRAVLARVEAAAAGTDRADTVRRLVAEPPRWLEAPAEAISEVLAVLAGAGGASAWLSAHGLAEEKLTHLRARLIDDAPSR